MAHLSNFGVGNFRAFNGTYNFEFKPITILTGTNSSGKSSLTKAILLFKSSYKGSVNGVPSFDILNFTPELQIGNFKTVINNSCDSDELVIEVPCRFTARCLSTIRLSYKVDKTQLMNGQLHKLEIYNNDDKIVFLTFSSEGNEEGLKVKFDVLYKMALHDTNIKFELYDASKKLKETLNNLGIGKIDEENLGSYSDEVVELYKTTQRLKFTSYVGHIRANDLSYTPIYYRKVGAETDRLPLFDYHCIVNKVYPKVSEKLYELYEHKRFSSYAEYQSFCEGQLAELNGDAKNANQTLVDFLLSNELKVLNSLLFKVDDYEIDAYIEAFGHDEDLDTIHFNWAYENLKYFLQGSYSIGSRQVENPVEWTTNYETILSKKNGIYSSFFKGEERDIDPIIHLCGEKFRERLIDRKKIWKAIDSIYKEDGIFGAYYINSKSFLANSIDSLLSSSAETLEKIFKPISYIPSVRADVSRRYRLGDNHTELQKLLNQFFSSTPAGVKSNYFIDKYVSVFNIGDKVEFVIADDRYDSRVILYKNGKQFDLADVGYGYSQLLPIILKIGIQMLSNHVEFIFGSSILIIEEPETNLHPALQSKLADMFIECYTKYNIQFIIETHSEYLIRRLQRRTAEFYNDKKKNEYSIPDDFTKIYYFYPPDNVPEGEKQIYPINIQKDGSLTKNFGRGFFDEAATEDLLLYQTAKHNNN